MPTTKRRVEWINKEHAQCFHRGLKLALLHWINVTSYITLCACYRCLSLLTLSEKCCNQTRSASFLLSNHLYNVCISPQHILTCTLRCRHRVHTDPPMLRQSILVMQVRSHWMSMQKCSAQRLHSNGQKIVYQCTLSPLNGHHPSRRNDISEIPGDIIYRPTSPGEY